MECRRIVPVRTSSPSGAAVRPPQTPPVSFSSSFPEAEEASVAARTLERAARPELSAVLTHESRLPQIEFPTHAGSWRPMQLTPGVKSAGESRAWIQLWGPGWVKRKKTTTTWLVVNFYLLLEKLLSRRILIAGRTIPWAVLQMLNYVIYRSEQQKKKRSLPAELFSWGAVCGWSVAEGLRFVSYLFRR